MAWTRVLISVTLAASGCFAQEQTLGRFVTEVTKGTPENVNNLVEIGNYAIKHGDCFAELDEREVYCPDQNTLGAVKVRVEELGTDAEIVIPDVVIGTVFGGRGLQKRWRIAIARRGDVCRSLIPQSPAIVTLYAACYPLTIGRGKGLQNVDKDSNVK